MAYFLEIKNGLDIFTGVSCGSKCQEMMSLNVLFAVGLIDALHREKLGCVKHEVCFVKGLSVINVEKGGVLLNSKLYFRKMHSVTT